MTFTELSMADRLRRAGGIAAALLVAASLFGAAPAAADDDDATTSQGQKPASADPLPEPTALIAAAVAAQGGEGAFGKIQSTSFKAVMTTPMGDASIESKAMSDGPFLIKQSSPQVTVTLGYDGEVGWAHNDFAGHQLLERTDIEEARFISGIQEIAARMDDEYGDMKTLERSEFGGRDCYKVRMVHNTRGKEQFAFFDTESKLVAGLQLLEETPMGQSTFTMVFDEWQERDEVKVFSVMRINRMQMDMTMQFTEIQFNDVDADQFKLPEEVRNLVREQAVSPQQSDPEEVQNLDREQLDAPEPSDPKEGESETSDR